MEIPPSGLQARAPVPVAAPTETPAPVSGQSVEAVVTAVRPRLASGTAAGFILELDAPGLDGPLEASSPRSLEPGSRLLLRFVDSGRARVESVIENPRLPSAQTQAPAQQALREALPRQQPLAEAFTDMSRLLQTAPLPEEVKRGMERMLSTLPTPAQLSTGPGLRAAIAASGTFLESRLQRSDTRTPRGAMDMTVRPDAQSAQPRADTPPPDTSGNAASRLWRLLGRVAPPSAPARPAANPSPSGSVAGTGTGTGIARGAIPPNANPASASNQAYAPGRVPAPGVGLTPGSSAPPEAHGVAQGATTIAPPPSPRPMNPADAPAARAPTPGNPAAESSRSSPPSNTLAAQEPRLQSEAPRSSTPSVQAAPGQPEHGQGGRYTGVPTQTPADGTTTVPQQRAAPVPPMPATATSRTEPPTAAPDADAPAPTSRDGLPPDGRRGSAAPAEQGSRDASLTRERLPSALDGQYMRPPAAARVSAGTPGPTAGAESGSTSTSTSAPTASNATPVGRATPAPAAEHDIDARVPTDRRPTPPGISPRNGPDLLQPRPSPSSPNPYGPAGAAGTASPPAPPQRATATAAVPIGNSPETQGPVQPKDTPPPPPSRSAPDLSSFPRPPVAPQQRGAASGVEGEQPRQSVEASGLPPLPARAPAPPTARGIPRTAHEEPGTTADTSQRTSRRHGTLAAEGGTQDEALRRDLKASLGLLRSSLLELMPRGSATGLPLTSATPEPSRLGQEVGSALYNARGQLPAGSDPLPGAASSGGRDHGSRTTKTPEDDAVGQLLRLVEGALARTRVHQLASLNDARTPNDPAGSAPAWSIEIPIPSASGFDSLRLRLEEPPGRRGETARESREWSVMLCLDCASLGPIHALVRLTGHRLGTTLWAERESTVRAAREAIGGLEEALRAQGVEVERVECLPGRPPEPAALRFGRLLDVRT